MGNVLVVAPDFPPVVGGVSRILEDVCDALPAEDVHVLAPWGVNYAWHEAYDMPDKSAARQFDSARPYRVTRAWYSMKSPLRTLFSVAWFGALTLKLAVREKPALVYFGQPYPIGLIGLAVWLLGVRYVVHTYGSELVRPRSRVASWLHRTVLKRAFRVIAISRWGKQTLSAMGAPRDRVVVIHPKVDVARFATPPDLEEFKKREGLEGKRVILTVSRVAYRKGQHLVVEAMPEVIRRFPDAVYVVAGTGPDEEKLERLAAENGVGDHVLLVGNRDIVSFYHACDVFILPSLYIQKPIGDIESFGIVYIEAGACGKPVIGSNNGGIPDAVADGESGLLIETGSVEAIADALNKLLGDPGLRERLGRQGRARVLRSFTLDKYKDDLRELILEPLERDRGG